MPDSALVSFLEHIEELLTVWMEPEFKLDTNCLDLVVRTSTDQIFCGVTIEIISFEEEDRFFAEIDLYLMDSNQIPIRLGPTEAKLKALLLDEVNRELRWGKVDFCDSGEGDEVQVSLTRNELISGLFDETDAQRINNVIEEMEGEFESVHRLVMQFLLDPDTEYPIEKIRFILDPSMSASASTH